MSDDDLGDLASALKDKTHKLATTKQYDFLTQNGILMLVKK